MTININPEDFEFVRGFFSLFIAFLIGFASGGGFKKKIR